MLITVNYNDIENTLEKYILVDVRSPKEFQESTITGAFNIPLFSDAERAHVGTVYKREGKNPAVKLGVEYVSKTLPAMYESFAKLLTKQKKFLIFCARGGMRSEAVATFLSSIGFSVVKLDKGYKGYRQHVVTRLPELIERTNTVTLFGKTGSGKTHILHEMQKLSRDVLDLEACANHRGSLLGAIGLPHKRSQKQFETLLYDALKNAKSPVIFTEGESKRIGNVYIPNLLMEKILKGRKVLIETELHTRREIIKADYINETFDKQAAIAAINTLVRYIGKERIKEYATLVEAGVYDFVIEELMIKYYDIVYNTLHETYEKTFMNKNSRQTAEDIIAYINK